MPEKRIGEPKESVELERKIGSSAELATSLGFERNKDEKSTWLHVYQKPIEGGYISLTFQSGKYKDQRGERITLTIGHHKDKTNYDREINLCQDPMFQEIINKIGLSINSAGMFLKPELIDGGYEKLYPYLVDLENSGFYEDALKKKTQ